MPDFRIYTTDGRTYTTHADHDLKAMEARVKSCDLIRAAVDPGTVIFWTIFNWDNVVSIQIY